MENRIRVLHVIGKRPKGGIGTFLENVTKYIDNDKFQFDFLINGDDIPGEFDKKMYNLGSKVYILPELSYRTSYKYLKALNEFYKNNNQYHIIHIHSPNIAVFNYFFSRLYTSTKIATHSHSTKFSDKTLNSIRNFFLHAPIKVITDIKFACNYASSEFMYGKEATINGDVNIAKNGIEVERYSFNRKIRDDKRSELHLGESLVLGHVGAFVPVKNHEYLVEIFSEIHKIEPTAVLILVGDGELVDTIMKKVSILEINDSVRFLGRRQDVNQIMQALDLFILPSKFEGMPLVGIEAQAAGLPCFFSSSVSKEIAITEDVNFLDINEAPIKWANTIIEYTRLNLRNKNRELSSQMIIDNGYDISETVKEIESVYLKYIRVK